MLRGRSKSIAKWSLFVVGLLVHPIGSFLDPGNGGDYAKAGLCLCMVAWDVIADRGNRKFAWSCPLCVVLGVAALFYNLDFHGHLPMPLLQLRAESLILAGLCIWLLKRAPRDPRFSGGDGT
jgi:hypothetical protein